MKKRIILPALMLLLISWVMDGCVEEESLKVECVMQIKDVGLREGVFARRYQMTGDYGGRESFSPEILKTFIKKVLEPDYLLIQDAYDRGMHEEDQVNQKIEEYRISLLAASHPSQYENMTISNEELREFYEKKTVKYDVDVVLANSFSMADTVYKYLQAGNKMKPQKRNEESMIFPKILQYQDITYGEELHFDLFPRLINMKTGQISEPVYTGPYWAIIILHKKSKNNNLKSFEQERKQLAIQSHGLFKYKKNKKLLAGLKDKYQVSIRTEYYQPLISAYAMFNEYKRIAPNLFKKSDLQGTFLIIDDKEISLSRFISVFNLADILKKLPALTEKDLSRFVDNYINQYVLYLDALEKGADKDVLVQDKLVNKEHRILLSKYLKEEIAQKVRVTDADARRHYENNRDKWIAEYKDVEKSVKFDLRNKRLHERKNELTNKLRKKYNVRYNEPLLMKLAERLTEEKKGKSKEITGQ